jgi:hypothetical protein
LPKERAERRSSDRGRDQHVGLHAHAPKRRGCWKVRMMPARAISPPVSVANLLATLQPRPLLAAYSSLALKVSQSSSLPL